MASRASRPWLPRQSIWWRGATSLKVIWVRHAGQAAVVILLLNRRFPAALRTRHPLGKVLRSALQLCRYLGTVLATIRGTLFFQEVPDGWTIAAILVIVAASLYVWHREIREA